MIAYGDGCSSIKPHKWQRRRERLSELRSERRHLDGFFLDRRQLTALDCKLLNQPQQGKEALKTRVKEAQFA